MDAHLFPVACLLSLDSALIMGTHPIRMQSIEVEDGINGVERTRFPLPHLIEHGEGPA